MMTVAFSGDLTIRCAADIKHRLMDALNSGSPLVHVDCRAVEAADLSFIQLLLAARKSMAGMGARLQLVAPASGSLLDVLQRAGFLDPSADDQTFWTNSEGDA